MKTLKLIAMLFFAIFVSACGGGGGGGGSPTPTPPAPTGVSATSDSSTQISVSWTAITGATGYDVYRSIAANQSITAMDKLTDTPTTLATYSNSSLSSNTTYYYKVVANNSNGAGTPSAEVSAMTRPAAPTGITATANSGSQITVSWASMIGVSSYNVYRSTTANQALSQMTLLPSGTGITSNAFVDTGLSNATTYYYKIAANNVAGAGDASAEASALTNSTAASVNATAISATEITVSWAGAAGDIGYDVYRSTTAGQNIAVMTHLNTILLTATNYTDSGLNPNTTYYYKVVTTNGSGVGAPSADATATTPLLLMGGTMQGQALTLAGNVLTYAGSGAAGSVNGNVSISAATVTFNNPHSITTDGKALYVADYLNNKIRKIDPNTDEVTTFAGSGVTSSTDGIGAAAAFNRPVGITTDGNNLYVTDYGSNKIRKVNLATAQASTIAGAGGVGAFLDGAANVARFNQPHSITTDGTNLYVGDAANNRIRQIRLSDGNVSTLAGSTVGWADGTGITAKFSYPRGVTTDGINVYVADSNNHRIRQIVIASKVVTTLAGSATIAQVDGTGTAASFNQPYDITTDGTNLFLVDATGNKVRQIAIATGIVTTVAGSGVAGELDGTGAGATFNAPLGITAYGSVLGSGLFVTDSNNKIRVIE